MKQFGKILKFELKNYFTNKVFVGITLFLMIVIAFAMFFPQISSFLDSDTDIRYPEENNGEQAPNDSVDSLPVMLIYGKEAQNVKDVFSEAFSEYNVQVAEGEESEIKDKIVSGDAECAFILDSLTSFKYCVNNLSMYDSNQIIAMEILQTAARMNVMIQNGISFEDAENILSLEIESEVETLGKDQMENYLYTYVMIMALYMVILLYGQMVATNVATEKSSRAMELLITTANPTSMMFGKVIASCLAGLIQLICVFGTAFAAFNLNRKFWDSDSVMTMIFDIPLHLLVYMIVFFVLGFAVYAFMYGAMGSVASKLEDINTLVMPITLIFVAGFLVVVFSFTSDAIDSVLMKICSFVPFTAPMAMFTRIAMGNVAIYEIIISIVILIISAIAIGAISAKIYRVGVLLYGARPKIKDILNTVKKS